MPADRQAGVDDAYFIVPPHGKKVTPENEVVWLLTNALQSRFRWPIIPPMPRQVLTRATRREVTMQSNSFVPSRTVHLCLTFLASAAVAGLCLLPGGGGASAQGAGDKDKVENDKISENNLKQIGIALVAHHDV